MGVLPFLIHEDAYGEVPIPGSAILHLPARNVLVRCNRPHGSPRSSECSATPAIASGCNDCSNSARSPPTNIRRPCVPAGSGDPAEPAGARCPVDASPIGRPLRPGNHAEQAATQVLPHRVPGYVAGAQAPGCSAQQMDFTVYTVWTCSAHILVQALRYRQFWPTV